MTPTKQVSTMASIFDSPRRMRRRMGKKVCTVEPCITKLTHPRHGFELCESRAHALLPAKHMKPTARTVIIKVVQKICRYIRLAMRRRWHYILRDDSTVIRGYSMFPRSFVNHNHAGCGTEADSRRITYGKQRVTRSKRANEGMSKRDEQRKEEG